MNDTYIQDDPTDDDHMQYIDDAINAYMDASPTPIASTIGVALTLAMFALFITFIVRPLAS